MKSMLGFAVLLLSSACTLPPVDPFVGAQKAMKRHDLLSALKQFERVPVDDPRYQDARAAASDVEQRIRRCHELVLEALKLRAEWRDSEALRALYRARQQWPDQPDLAQWISATENRLELFGYSKPKALPPEKESALAVEAPVAEVEIPSFHYSQGDLAAIRSIDRESEESPAISDPQPALPTVAETTADLDSAASVEPEPVARTQQAPDDDHTALEVSPVASAVTPTGSNVLSDDVPKASTSEDGPNVISSRSDDVAVSVGAAVMSDSDLVVAPARDVAVEVVETPAASEIANPTRPALSEDPVALGLVLVEARIGLGELNLAVGDLVELLQRFPNDRRVSGRVVDLLYQRALMYYGRGSMAAAFADWQFLLELDPDNRAVKKMIARAHVESVQARRFK